MSGWGKKAPSITLSQLRTLIQGVLPLRVFTIEELLAMVQWVQMKNHRAYVSHAKKKLGLRE